MKNASNMLQEKRCIYKYIVKDEEEESLICNNNQRGMGEDMKQTEWEKDLKRE